MLQDLRHAVRVLLQGKMWSAMVVLSLALGIGANTALFSATNGLLLRKLPVEDPDTLVRLRHVGRNSMANNTSEYGNIVRRPGAERVGATFSYPTFAALRQANETLTALAASVPISVNVVVDGQAEIATAYLATGNYHEVLGVRALRGRTLLAEDDQANVPPVSTISEQFWVRRFGRVPDVIGKVIRANDTPVTIVGVTPAAFTGVQRVIADAPDLVLPLALDRLLTLPGAMYPGGPNQARLDQPTFWWLQVFGRLKPGVTAAQVEGNLGGVFRHVAREGMSSFLSSAPDAVRSAASNRDRTDVSRLSVTSMARGLVDTDPAGLRGVAIISAIVALILLLVCANVANLLLSRAAARQREIAVRLSIGATRMRLVRQLLTESVLLALVGGALGLLVAWWGRGLLPGTAGQAPLDWRVLVFTSGVALATGILFGIAPALRVTGTGALEALKETSRSIIGSRALLPKSLLVIQVAISLVLLIGAGLFLRTVYNLRQVDVGFDPENLVVFGVNPRLNRYDAARITSLYDRLLERLRATPGVRAATLSNPPLLAGGISTTNFIVQGRTYEAGLLQDPRSQANVINRVTIAPSFFETMAMPLLRGRQLDERDDMAAPRVALINEAAARKYFPDEDPMGRRFGTTPETSNQIEIIGVVRDAKYSDLREPPPPTMYLPYTQFPAGAMSVVVRTREDPAAAMPAIREVVRQVDANVPMMNMATQTDLIERRFAQERVFAQAYTLFGALALLVAAIGIFGLMSYNVTRRTTEIGIRMALGAERRTVLQMILRESLVLVAIGVIIGIGAALAAGRTVGSLLFGLQATDVTTMAVAVALMLAVSTLAGYLPARRASRLGPMEALRHD
jgi:predicted permease